MRVFIHAWVFLLDLCIFADLPPILNPGVSEKCMCVCTHSLSVTYMCLRDALYLHDPSCCSWFLGFYFIISSRVPHVAWNGKDKCVCVHVCMRTQGPMHIPICMHDTRTHACPYMYACTQGPMHVLICMHVCAQANTYACMHVCMHICAQTNTHDTWVHTCTFAYMHMNKKRTSLYIHTYIHTHMHTYIHT